MKTNLSIDVNVKLELTENSVNLLRSLFATAMPTNCYNPQPIATEDKAAEEVKAKIDKAAEEAKAKIAEEAKAKAAEEAKTKVPAEKKPVAPEAPQPSERKVGIEDVRSILTEKVNDHRAAIKQKLTELGAPNVTKLDPAKYIEMYDFLKSL